MKDRITRVFFAAPLIALSMMTGGVLAVGPPDPPDLTQGETKGIELKRGTYNLGSTGLRGWIYHEPASNLDMRQGRTTFASRQILVTHVGARSPADGVIKVDDVILGVNGKPFSGDARKTMARAIQEAENALAGEAVTAPAVRPGQAIGADGVWSDHYAEAGRNLEQRLARMRALRGGAGARTS